MRSDFLKYCRLVFDRSLTLSSIRYVLWSSLDTFIHIVYFFSIVHSLYHSQLCSLSIVLIRNMYAVHRVQRSLFGHKN